MVRVLVDCRLIVMTKERKRERVRERERERLKPHVHVHACAVLHKLCFYQILHIELAMHACIYMYVCMCTIIM